MSLERETILLLPKGEWLEAMLLAFKIAGLELYSQPRSYVYSFVHPALPIIFQAIRSKEVIEAIFDWETSVNGGFTGSDIAVEQRVNTGDSRFWEFPISQMNPDAPLPRVYLGATPNIQAKESSPSLVDLNGTTIYTEYPTITQQYLEEIGVHARIKAVQGGSEGRWRIDPRNGAIVTIRNTDATMKANQIQPLADIMTAGILYVEGPNIQPSDQLRVDDLRELIYRALIGFADRTS